ncbi:microtubule-associated serine/threonine-protein kinase 4-like [Ranitomeya variabilis]|uniref:microtubule-associated serine/threonine-protein kinase 4-like n=1 Tax=Ranitomeya variabilis TaxID=490064 RepID=UPI0040562B7E
MADYLLDTLQVDALWEIIANYNPDTALLPPDGVLSFTHRLVMGLVNDCLTKYYQGRLTSVYLTDLLQNIKTLLEQAEKRHQDGDLSIIKELAQKVLSAVERPARSSERLETAEGDTQDGQNLHPEIIPDPNTSQRELTRDLITDTTVVVNPNSVICEIPKIQEPAASVIESLIPARKPQLSDFKISKLIGSGAFGAVHLVLHKDSRQLFAMKKLAKRNLHDPKRVKLAFLERDILTFCDSPFVVSMLCSFPTKLHLCIVMEYVRGGDCQTLLNTRGRLPVPLARLYFAEAALAVEYLHSYGVVHRDLKPENLLITSAGHIKVADFGISKVGLMISKNNIYKHLAEDITKEFRDHEVCGTLYYAAPEVILQKGYGRAADWWSMGIILYQFLMGFVPFKGKSQKEVIRKIFTGVVAWNYNPVPPFAAQSLIVKLLRKDPVYRLGTAGAFEVKNHPFLIDLDFDNLLSQQSEYVPQLASDVDIHSYFNYSDINNHLLSGDDNQSFNFQNFTSSSERLSKLYTTATREMNNEDPKSPRECAPASSTNISEIQKESFPVFIRDNAITSLPSLCPLSEIPVHKERKSSIYLSIEHQNSNNEEKWKKIQENPAHEERMPSIYFSIENQNSENEEKEEKRQENPAHEERMSSINFSIEQEISQNEEKGEKRQEFPAQEDRTSEKKLSIDQEKSQNKEKRGKRRGNRLRRILSSCRRGLSRVARVFTCCSGSPTDI